MPSPLSIHQSPTLSRRELLRRSGVGLGMLGLAGVLADGGLLGSGTIASAADAEPGGYKNPLSEKQPHFAAKAKRVIHLFMNGGPSHVDTFDRKTSLDKFAGKPLPMENLATERKTGAAFTSPYKWQRY